MLLGRIDTYIEKVIIKAIIKKNATWPKTIDTSHLIFRRWFVEREELRENNMERKNLYLKKNVPT